MLFQIPYFLNYWSPISSTIFLCLAAASCFQVFDTLHRHFAFLLLFIYCCRFINQESEIHPEDYRKEVEYVVYTAFLNRQVVFCQDASAAFRILTAGERKSKRCLLSVRRLVTIELSPGVKGHGLRNQVTEYYRMPRVSIIYVFMD